MANETIIVAGTETTLESSGASTGTTVFTKATTSFTGGTGGNSKAYPMLAVEFSGTWATAPAIGEVVNIYARALNFESTNDAQAPNADFPHTFVCSIPLEDVTSAQYHRLAGVPNPFPLTDADYYIENATGQTLGAGWTLKVTSQAFGPAA